MLVDVFPGSTPDDASRCFVDDAETGGYVDECDARSRKRPYCADGGWVQLGVGSPVAGSGGFPAASLGEHVGDVVLRRANKQMVRVAAAWLVASVAYEQGLRNRPARQLVCETMRKVHSIVDVDSSIANTDCVPGPQPALVAATNIDSAPKVGWLIGPSWHQSILSGGIACS